MIYEVRLTSELQQSKEAKESQALLRVLEGLEKSKGLRLLEKQNGETYVLLRGMNKEYRKDYLERFPKEAQKAQRVKYDDFFKRYLIHKKDYGGKPSDFAHILFVPQDARERYLDVQGKVTVPIRLDSSASISSDPISVKTDTIETGGKASMEFTVGRGVRETGARLSRGYVGIDVSTEIKPVVGVEAREKGLFMQTVEGFKKLAAGFIEGVFSFTATFGKAVKYFFSITLGPWIGRFDFATGRISGVFSWLAAAFEMGQRLIGRLFEDKLVLETRAKPDDIKKGSVLRGVLDGGLAPQIKVRERQGDKIIDVNGKEYKIAEENGVLNVYESRSFFKRLGIAFSPLQLLSNAIDILLVSPWFKMKETYYTFKAPPEGKLGSEGEKDACKTTIQEAIRRGNLNTARHNLYLLVNSSEGGEKALYMNELDMVEWKLGNSGLPFGYISREGFGIKRKMATAAISRRINHALQLLEKKRKETPGAKQVADKDYAVALAYLKNKSQFRAAGLGKRVPKYPLPDGLKNRVLDEMEKQRNQPAKSAGNFEQLTIPRKDEKTEAAKNWKKFMQLFQTMREKTDKKEVQDELDKLFRVLRRDMQPGARAGLVMVSYMNDWLAKLKNNKAGLPSVLPEKPEVLDMKTLEKYYGVFFPPEKKAS